MNLSVVIPARDEEETIGQLIQDIRDTLANHPQYPYEIIVVDDGSKDQTARICREKEVKLISDGQSQGKGAALRKGFHQAKGEILIMMDADYSHRAEDLPCLLEGFREKETGLVIASRMIGGSDEYTIIRSIGNIFLTEVLSLILKLPLTDSLNGFKLFRRQVWDQFRYRASSFDIEIELIVNTMRSGLRVKEIPSHERSRQGGQAKSRVIKHGCFFLYRILLEGTKYRFERSWKGGTGTGDSAHTF